MIITDLKEDTHMKRTNQASRKVIPFCPNAKNKQYYVDKATDYALAFATSMGAVTAMLFFALL